MRGDKREENHSQTLDRQAETERSGVPGTSDRQESNGRGIRHTERDRNQRRGLYQAA